MDTITLPFTEARNKLTKLVEDVDKYFNRFVITLRGRPRAVLMSKEEYDGMMETMEIMADKKLIKDIREGLADIKAGRVITEKELMRKVGIKR